MVAQTHSTAKTLITQTMAVLSGRRLLLNSFQKALGAEASLKSNSPKSSSSHNLSSENRNGKLSSHENLVVRDRVAPEFRTGRQHLVSRDNRAHPWSPNPRSIAVLLISCIPKAPSIRRTVKITRWSTIGTAALGSPIRRSFRDNDLLSSLINEILEVGVPIGILFKF